MEHKFLYSAAPVLRGAKPAALITLRPNCLKLWRDRQNALRKATGLQTLEIINGRGARLLLIYDEEAVRGIFQDRRTLNILTEYGYPAECGLKAGLSHLKSRFSEGGFPHEIGLFLGYPPEDVRSFILNEGRNYVCCRHWKVYHDVERALETFRQIDEAQSRAAEILREPKPIHIAAKLLKAV